jgi:hypothetical protein
MIELTPVQDLSRDAVVFIRGNTKGEVKQGVFSGITMSNGVEMMHIRPGTPHRSTHARGRLRL